jgi:hypothetical protein
MAGPFDYITPNASANPFGTTLQGFQAGQQIAQQQQQSQLAQQQIQAQMELQRQYQQDAGKLLQNPGAGARDFAAFQLKYPQFREATKGAFEQLSADQQQTRVGTLSRVYSALNSGRKDLALNIANDNLKALENSGANPQEINALKGNIQLIETLPLDQARNAAAMALSTVADPKQFSSLVGQLGSEQRAQQEQPFKQQKLSAEAQFAGPKAQAEIDNVRSQISDRAAKLGLDNQKFQLEFDKTLTELRQKGGVKPSAGMEKIQADSVGAATIAQQASDDAAQLADQFRNANVGRGAFSTLGEYAAKVTGNQDAITQLRKRYVQIKNQAALSMLPPGPASDRDIQIVQSGFLPETADSKQIADWLTSFGNVQKAVALRENAKADWISEVGSTGKAPRDIEVSGIQVPAGTGFNDFLRRGLKPQNITNPQAEPQGGAQPAATPRYLDPSSWGRTNTVSTPAATSVGVTQLPPA